MNKKTMTMSMMMMMMMMMADYSECSDDGSTVVASGIMRMARMLANIILLLLRLSKDS